MTGTNPASVSASPDNTTCWIVVLNWNNAADTLACIDSIIRLQKETWRLAVCDNASSDGALDILAAGLQSRFGSQWRKLAEKDVPNTRVDEGFKAYLIANSGNHGYAGGNNVGMRLALRDPAMRFVWVLNNDTEVAPDSLGHLLHHADLHPTQGIIGSTLLYHDRPGIIQAAGGGTYHRWTGLCDHHGYGKPAESRDHHANRPLDYVFGAALFIRRAWLEQVGLMDESFFLYFEEIDYCRSGRHLFDIGYCPDSMIYHKEGGSTGGKRHAVSLLADFYNLRNRLRITRRHFPYALPTVWLGMMITILNRLRRGQADRVGMVLRIAFQFGHIDFKDIRRGK
ncbi:glycosyltransferase family 2 protein [Niveispirillum irakense]|uniref:glycosyltransferase family 2 protein n=1 Tax=Niveispirillum irakense TaxID=34011 RepID=UPI0006858732|nr:glycosyltransferase family 2 protein [Niveispirillum irakense]